MFTFKRVYYDADKGTGGGATDPEPVVEPKTDPKVEPKAEPKKDLTGGVKPGGDGQIQMSSEQLSERLERAKNAERAALLKELGFDNLDAVKTAAAELAELKKASMTDKERTEAELANARSLAEQEKARADAADRARHEALVRSEAMVLMTGRFANPTTAIRLLDLSAVKVGEDGQVSGMKEAVEKLAQDEPWALSQTNGKKVLNPVGPTNTEAGKKALTGDVERKTKYFGGSGASDFFAGGGVKSGG